MDCWMSNDPPDKNDAGKFLDYLESTLDDEISPCVRVYELEDIKKRTDETIDALIYHIWQLASHALIGDGRYADVEFKVQCRLIHAIPDSEIELWKEHLKVGHTKGVSHLLEIWHKYFAFDSRAAVMCSGKTINAVQKSHWPQKQPQMQPSPCWNCTCQHLPGCDICPAQESVCKGCLKKGHWQTKYCSSKNNQSTVPVENQWKGMHGQFGMKGKKADLLGVHTEEPLCDDIFLDDVCAPHTNEIYTTVHLPASTSNKGMASLQVKSTLGQVEMFYHCI